MYTLKGTYSCSSVMNVLLERFVRVMPILATFTDYFPSVWQAHCCIVITR